MFRSDQTRAKTVQNVMQAERRTASLTKSNCPVFQFHPLAIASGILKSLILEAKTNK